MGSHAVVVLSDQDNIWQAPLNLMRFFAHESCRQCTPLVRHTKLFRMMAGPAPDTDSWDELAKVMADASICGLGQAAPNPLVSAMTHFPQDISPEQAKCGHDMTPMKQTVIEIDGQKVTASPGRPSGRWRRRQAPISRICVTKMTKAIVQMAIAGPVWWKLKVSVLAASCQRKIADGMVVTTASTRAKTARKMVMELLVADQPSRSSAHHQNSRLGLC